MFQTIAKLPRYARIIGLGMKSGRTAQTASALDNTVTARKLSQVPADLNNVSRYEAMADTLANRADNTFKTAKNYGNYYGLNKDTTIGLANFSHNTGRLLNPVLTPAENIGRPIGRMAGSVMMNPVGQMAIFTAPYFLTNSRGAEPDNASYPQATDMYAPPIPPPMPSSSSDMMSQGYYSSMSLDEEQISKARKRAEEQAALNQFYAQALQQYGDYYQ